MGFDIKVNDEVVHTLDVDSRLIQALHIGQNKIPVQFEQSDVNITVETKSLRDAEYLESLRREAISDYAQEKEPDLLAVAATVKDEELELIQTESEASDVETEGESDETETSEEEVEEIEEVEPVMEENRN